MRVYTLFEHRAAVVLRPVLRPECSSRAYPREHTIAAKEHLLPPRALPEWPRVLSIMRCVSVAKAFGEKRAPEDLTRFSWSAAYFICAEEKERRGEVGLRTKY